MQDLSVQWVGWRLRLLIGVALSCCLAFVLLTRWLADAPTLASSWRANALGQLELVSTAAGELRPFIGQALTEMQGALQGPTALDAQALRRSSRWVVSDASRAKLRDVQVSINAALRATSPVTLRFASGATVQLSARPRGWQDLGFLYWLLGGLGTTLILAGSVVLLSAPTRRNALYAVVASCQAGNLLLIAIETTSALTLPGWIPYFEAPLRQAFDLISAAAVVQVACWHPSRLPRAAVYSVWVWGGMAGLISALWLGWLPGSWWWTQVAVALFAAVAVALFSQSYHLRPNPFALQLRRLGVVVLATWVSLSVAFALSWSRTDVSLPLLSLGPVVVYALLGACLLLMPLMSRWQALTREFALLAAVSTLATSVDLLFVTVFSLGKFESLSLVLFIALALYAGVRHWVVSQMLGTRALTTERMFEQLYRTAREIELRPQEAPAKFLELLQALFEPVDTCMDDAFCDKAYVLGAGSTLVAPLPVLRRSTPGDGPRSVRLRFAHRGRRLFTDEDAQLTDRIVEQLQRAAAFEHAVELGRNEERMRLAQDLHDDIGARLLTLLYQAATPAMEQYVRHTLQDLKTLTRGLSASRHLLSHACVEWKTDLAHRLGAAHVHLEWQVDIDREVRLTVVQWSALTRILRELVSNVITHASATRVEVSVALLANVLTVVVCDDGAGADPVHWQHGLGLGGIRKRVRQLDGEVCWKLIAPRGIRCVVRVPRLDAVDERAV